MAEQDFLAIQPNRHILFPIQRRLLNQSHARQDWLACQRLWHSHLAKRMFECAMLLRRGANQDWQVGFVHPAAVIAF